MEQAGSKAFTVRAGADGSIICVSSNWHRSVSTLLAMHIGIDKSFDTSLFGTPSPGEEAETSLRPIRGQKIVLEHASKHLHDLLNSDDYTDSHQPVYHIENVDHDSLRRIINFIYTNELTLNAENAIEQMCGIIIGAKYLVMTTNLSPAGECEAFLAGHVNRENCVNLWCFARKYGCQALMHTTSSLIADDLTDIPSNGEFLRMQYKDLKELLPSEAFVGADVDQRCLAAVAWLEFDIVGRASHVSDVMSKIPLVSVSAATARKLNEREMLWEHAPKTMRKLTNALIDRLDAEESVSGGAGPNNAASWYVIGGLDSQKLFLQYNISERIWTTLPALPWDRCYFGACSGANRLMLMGGVKNEASTSGIDEYDLASKTWSISIAKLCTDSTSFEACSDGQFAYALGTCKGVEKYCLRSNKITGLSNMLKNRIFYAATFANNCIYAAGGSGDLEGVVEKYDIWSDQWAKIGNLVDESRFGVAGTITGDDFYLMGGQTNGGSASDAVQIFNIRTGQSYMGQRLLRARQGCRATTMDNGNVICVVGGWATYLGGLKSVETFDKREGKWLTGTIVPDMPEPASYFGLATM